MLVNKFKINGFTFDAFELTEQARQAMGKAYAPYSKFKVGAVAVDSQGFFFLGANIENASYGLTCCAERCALYSAVFEGKAPILAICVIGDTSNPISPCGACRQVIREFAHPQAKIILTNINGQTRIFTLDELLPYPFGPEKFSSENL